MYGDWMDSAGSRCGRFRQGSGGVDARLGAHRGQSRLGLCFGRFAETGDVMIRQPVTHRDEAIDPVQSILVEIKH